MQKQPYPFIIKHWSNGVWLDTGERWSSLRLAMYACKLYKDCCVFVDETFLDGRDFLVANCWNRDFSINRYHV